MEIDGKKMKYKLIESSILLDAFIVNDPIDFREEDGRYHSGYRLVNKKEDNSEFIIERPNGTQFTLMWWKVIDLKNKNSIRTSWDFNDPYPIPDNYECTVEELQKITELFKSESSRNEI